MTHVRYHQLVGNIELELTDAEIDAGWHFCYDWDGMLIHSSDKEAEVCTCRKVL